MRKLLGRTFRKRKKKKLETSVISENDSQDHKTHHFLFKWMVENGYKPPKKLRPKYFHDSGRGLMTQENICSGDTILCIPQNLLITSEVVSKSELGIFFKRYCPKASGHQMLSVFLMFEKAKGKLSDWYYYIETLPQSYNIPAFYEPQCLIVAPPFIYEQVFKQIQAVKDSYNQLDVLLKKLKHEFPFACENVDFNIYKWAWCSVNTRCVFIDCFKNDCIGKTCQFHLALAPFLDLLNHSIHVQVQASFNPEKKHYEIISLCDFKKYSQVFINYGSHDNSMLFLEYGFIVPDNYNDSISFSLDNILSAYKQAKQPSYPLNTKLQFILESDLIKNLVCSCDGLSWNLKLVLRILTTDYDLKWWKSALCNYMEPETDSDAFNKMKKELLRLKFNEITSNPIGINSPCKYSSLRDQISQLLAITKSILIKAME